MLTRVQTYYGQTTRLKLDRDSVVTRQSLRVAEWHLYGSSRLGIYKTQDTLRTVDLSLVYQLSNITLAPTQTLSKKEFYSFDSTYTHKRGDKLYEGSNHLGNVLVTFSDKRLAECLEGSVHYRADVRSATDYAAFHALLDDRQWHSSTDSAFYRYGGSNGQEKDDEIYGTGNSYSAEFWQYDPRLGRRWNVDPVEKWNESPYSCFSNNPIFLIDINGADTTVANNKSGNVIVWVQDSDDINYDKMKQNNWDLIIVKDISDAAFRLKEYSNNGKISISNLVLRTHGNTGQIQAGGINFTAETFGFKQVHDYRINGKESTEISNIQAKGLNAIIQMSGMLKDGGNFVITSCRAGEISEHGDLGLELGRLLISDLGYNINLYMNQDQSSYYISREDNKKRTYLTKFDVGLTEESRYNHGWSLFRANASGRVERTNLNGNIGLSSKGTHPIFYKKHISEKPWWSFLLKL